MTRSVHVHQDTVYVNGFIHFLLCYYSYMLKIRYYVSCIEFSSSFLFIFFFRWRIRSNDEGKVTTLRVFFTTFPFGNTTLTSTLQCWNLERSIWLMMVQSQCSLTHRNHPSEYISAAIKSASAWYSVMPMASVQTLDLNGFHYWLK